MFNKLTRASQKLSPGLRRIIGNTGWLFADRILRMGGGLFIGVWVARYLGPEQYGMYNYAIAFVTIFNAIASLGLDGIIVRNIVRNPSCKNETLGTAFSLKLSSGITTLLLAIGIINLLRPGDSLTHWLVGIIAAGLIFRAFDTIDLWFQSQVQSKYTVYARNIGFILTSFIKIFLIRMQAPLIAFAWVLLVEIVLGAVGLMLVYQAKGGDFRVWKSNLLHAITLLKASWPLILSGLVIMVYLKIDQIMLGEMTNAEAVGIYSAAVRLSEVWYFIPTAIVASVFPSIIKAKETNTKLYYKRLQELFSLMTGCAYIVALPMTFFSKEIVILLFGKDYAAAGSVLAIHIWSAAFIFLSVSSGQWFLIEDMQIYAFLRNFVGAIANIGLNFALIPSYGAQGAAVATLISYGLTLVAPFFFTKKYLLVGKIIFKSFFVLI